MKTKHILFICSFAFFLKTNAQERNNFQLSYDLYQAGKASYELSNNGNITQNIDNIKFNHFLYDLTIRFDNYYFRIDASAIAGTFLDKVISNKEKNYLQTTHVGIGFLTTNSPLQITDNSDLVFGITGFIDSAFLDANGLQDKVDFGTYGYSLIADYQMGDSLNAFVEYARGKRGQTDGENIMRSFRARVSYNIYNGIYLTGTANIKKFEETEANELHKVNATTFSLGLLFN